MKTTLRALLMASFACLLDAASGTYRIDTVAGSFMVGDGGPALRAPLHDAQGVAVDRAGNTYIADAGDHRIRKISPAGTITTLAGTGAAGFSGDEGPAALAQLNLPYGVTVDSAGIVYIADLGNNRVRRVAVDGTISSLPGTFKSPRNVLADAAGNIYVSEFSGNRVRRINLDGTITTVSATLNSPAGLALDSKGNLYVAESGNSVIRKITGGSLITVLGTGAPGSATAAQLNLPTGVALDAFGNLYVADSGNNRIRKLTATGTVSTIARPARDLAIDLSGNLLIASGERLTKELVSGATAVVAGDGSYLLRGDGGAATEARLNAPTAVAVDAAGMLFIADTSNSRIRSVAAGGVISTFTTTAKLAAPTALSLDSAHNLLIADPAQAVIWNATPAAGVAAGNSSQNFSGDGLPAALAALARPSGVVAVPNGGFYLADTGNHRVRRVNSGGTITTVAGLSTNGWNGDGIALGATLNEPTALALDPAGNLFIADTNNNRIRKLSPDGQLLTVAGGTGAALSLNHPRGLAIDPAGTLWVADTDNHRILTVSPEGTVTIAAGIGSAGFTGDGGGALAAAFSFPSGLASDSAGNIFVADTGNNRVRVLTAPPPALTESSSSGYAVVGAASLLSGLAAPCSLVTIFGADAASASILFDGGAAVPIASAPGQATVQVPCSAAPPSIQLAVGSWRLTLPIAAAAPALFALNAGSGQALALNANGTPNSEANRAAAGSTLSLFATGMGLPANAAGVIVGRTTADILFAGDAPGLIGITQINIQLPAAISGVQPVTVLSANVASQAAVTIAIQ